MKPIVAFASQFGAKVALNPEFIAEQEQRYYLLNPRVKKFMRNDFFYAGLYLGKVKNNLFFPSFNLLNMLVEIAANKVVLEPKTAWLFICGRDIFKKGIIRTHGAQRKGDCTLVMNQFGECLGFGRITEKLDNAEGKVVIRNILDVGDFLRRES
jgi:ribosome biogenesis protein Nip4